MFKSQYDADHYSYPTVCNPDRSIEVCLNCQRPTCILDLCDPSWEDDEQKAFLPEYIRAGEALQQARKRVNMTRKEFAVLCGYTIRVIDRWEHGETEIPCDARKVILKLFPEMEGVLNDKKDNTESS